MRAAPLGLFFVSLMKFPPLFAATVLITGSDRGIGLEFAAQYAARGDNVIATCRHPDASKGLQGLAAHSRDLIIEPLDVASDADIKALAKKYKGRPIDILINNAGVLGNLQDQKPGNFNRRTFHTVLDVNVFGALAVAEAFLDNVLGSHQKKIISITSGLSSIASAAENSPSPYFYDLSKAALNMAMQTFGADLKGRGVVVAVITPGVVDTDMLASYRAGYPFDGEPTSKAVSVGKMVAVIDKLDQKTAQSGIITSSGNIISW